MHESFDLIGADIFHYISFRALMAAACSVLIATIIGSKIICFLQKQQIGETIRDLGLEGQIQKKGTPTMGGIIIIFALVVPVLLFARIDNIYIIILLVTVLWTGMIGFLDDYIKVFKKNKEGLAGRFKIIGQVGLGLIIGISLYIQDDVVLRTFDAKVTVLNIELALDQAYYVDKKSTRTTIPFFKGNEFDYQLLNPSDNPTVTWIIYIVVIIFIITAVSNSANMTDGLDGLSAGTTATVGSVLAIFAYVSGNFLLATYLNIMYIPHTGEIVIFCAAFVGACIGFLWYNTFPAQVFMGDTGSLSIGSTVAVLAIILRKELLIPLLCGIYLVESVSVILQVGYFKYTKKRYGQGKRLFLMAPLHHHFQKKNIPEPKIVNRFWIVGIVMAILTLVTLKVR